MLAAISRWASQRALDDFLAGQREMMRAALADVLAEPPSTSHYTVLADGG